MTMVWSPNDLGWDCDPCLGTLTINGESLNRLAWCADLTPLWGGPAVRGENVIIPGAAGRDPNLIRVDETVWTLPFRINGHWDRSGVAVPAGDNLWAQLEENVSWLLANITPVTVTAGGTDAAVLTLPSGSTVSAAVQVLRIAPPTMLPGAIARTTIDIRDPGGALHL